MTKAALQSDAGGPAAVGVDVGGSKICAVLLAANGATLERRWSSHDVRGCDALVEAVARAAAGLEGKDERVAALPVGVAIAAWMSRDRTTLRRAANLGVADEPLAGALGHRLGREVTLENDGDATAIAESRLGAGRGSTALVVLALGTGVGGGIVLDGRAIRGAGGLAGEIGHLAVTSDGAPCVCGAIGCLELQASGPAIASRAGAATAKDALLAARAGSAMARAAFDHAAEALAAAIAATVALIDPDLVVFSGSVAIAGADLLLPAAREALARRLPIAAVRERPRLMLGELGADAAAIGAALLARDAAGG